MWTYRNVEEMYSIYRSEPPVVLALLCHCHWPSEHF